MKISEEDDGSDKKLPMQWQVCKKRKSQRLCQKPEQRNAEQKTLQARLKP